MPRLYAASREQPVKSTLQSAGIGCLIFGAVLIAPKVGWSDPQNKTKWPTISEQS